jgi:hypothetical protein
MSENLQSGIGKNLLPMYDDRVVGHNISQFKPCLFPVMLAVDATCYIPSLLWKRVTQNHIPCYENLVLGSTEIVLHAEFITS